MLTHNVKPLTFAACLNPATVSGLSFEQVARLAAATGIAMIEASIQQVVAYGPTRAADLLDELGIRVAAACGLLPDGPVLPHPLLVAPPTFLHAVDGLETRLEAFGAIGCRVATIVLNPRTDLDGSFAHDLASERLEMLGAACAEHGLTLAVEPVGVKAGLPASLDGHNPFIPSLQGLVQLLDAVGGATAAAALGVCVDSYHWAAAGPDPAQLTDLAPSRIAHVQIADTPATVTPEYWTDEMRLFPGDGTLPWPQFLHALTGAGYTGPLSVELFNPDLRRLPQHVIAQRALSAVTEVQGTRL
ncbi:sugar phosphate isomerase/epimerase family protein [Actinomadura opuntiae]|uniref:sugar phosphate isomerase/epimerase family protein n=1 Tax=Actinomadura sp. OS1-43 TaxID=604315 RepID=UPI00255AAD0B|nr:sugar phosphate isomerase/epimerase [Actinomadura sp. OS1-43]MDL4813073.1 sugar phosphate isomerase/epimerase [Actinomadura sp. OS1-43]